jgi:hypothetical protein
MFEKYYTPEQAEAIKKRVHLLGRGEIWQG